MASLEEAAELTETQLADHTCQFVLGDNPSNEAESKLQPLQAPAHRYEEHGGHNEPNRMRCREHRLVTKRRAPQGQHNVRLLCRSRRNSAVLPRYAVSSMWARVLG